MVWNTVLWLPISRIALFWALSQSTGAEHQIIKMPYKCGYLRTQRKRGRSWSPGHFRGPLSHTEKGFLGLLIHHCQTTQQPHLAVSLDLLFSSSSHVEGPTVSLSSPKRGKGVGWVSLLFIPTLPSFIILNRFLARPEWIRICHCLGAETQYASFYHLTAMIWLYISEAYSHRAIFTWIYNSQRM